MLHCQFGHHSSLDHPEIASCITHSWPAVNKNNSNLREFLFFRRDVKAHQLKFTIFSPHFTNGWRNSRKQVTQPRLQFTPSGWLLIPSGGVIRNFFQTCGTLSCGSILQWVVLYRQVRNQEATKVRQIRLGKRYGVSWSVCPGWGKCILVKVRKVEFLISERSQRVKKRNTS